MKPLTREQFIEGLIKHGGSREGAERKANLKFGPVKPAASAPIADTSSLRIVAECNDPARSIPIRAKRVGDALWLEFVTPPRTKKNHAETFGSGKSKPYKRYMADLVEAIAEVRDVLLLPLPDRRPLGYNLAAHFYVDGHTKTADYNGLDQGLCDALQNAGVVADDWVFRQRDHARVILDGRPRVELLITPIAAQTLPSMELP